MDRRRPGLVRESGERGQVFDAVTADLRADVMRSSSVPVGGRTNSEDRVVAGSKKKEAEQAARIEDRGKAIDVVTVGLRVGF